MINKVRAYLELMRPANIVTAFADILAGFAIAGGVISFTGEATLFSPEGLSWLLLSSFGLYGGGVVFNDVFDAELDAEERPERAIPSGRVSKLQASLLGTLLHLIGVITAFQVNQTAGFIAITIALLTIIYDSKAKHSVVFGPLFMGLCRGGNLLLGISIVPGILFQNWFLAFIPIVYIASITLISRGEVSGGSRMHGFIAVGMLTAVIIALLIFAFIPEYSLLTALPFLLLFAWMVFPAYLNAAINPEALTIKNAVKRGVLSLIFLNSVLAAGFSGLILGLIVALLFPISLLFSKLFAVT
ncbi:MAG: UbiA-like protein EboC [Balneolaceae bacterium]|nr:UbiA-like protein EboC [Balneolaceae bacterium]